MQRVQIEPIIGFGVGVELLEDDGEAFIFINLLLIRIIIDVGKTYNPYMI